MGETLRPETGEESGNLFPGIFPAVTESQGKATETRINKKPGRPYPFLSELLNIAPAEQAESILDNLGKLPTRNSRAILKKLFTISSCNRLLDSYYNSFFSGRAEALVQNAVGDLLRNPGILDLLPLMWDHAFEGEKDKDHTPGVLHTKLALSMLLGKLPPDKIPDTLKERLSGARTLDYKVMYPPSEKYLCENSEERLQHAMSPDHHSVVLVDGVMLAKVANGKLSAVCLYPVEGSNGILIPGVWYSPLEKSLRDKIAETYDDARLYLDLDAPSEWTIMRPAKPNYLDSGNESLSGFLNRLRSYALNLPLNPPREIWIPNHGLVSRREVRIGLYEYI